MSFGLVITFIIIKIGYSFILVTMLNFSASRQPVGVSSTKGLKPSFLELLLKEIIKIIHGFSQSSASHQSVSSSPLSNFFSSGNFKLAAICLILAIFCASLNNWRYFVAEDIPTFSIYAFSSKLSIA